MANSNSTSDILKGSLKKSGEATDGSSSYHELALRLLNNVYKSILAGSSEFQLDVGQPWPWARAENPRSITLKPLYETGSVSLANGSAAGTFSVAPDSSLGSFVGRFLHIPGRPDYFRITAHIAGATAFTLDANYTDDTGAALVFQAIPLTYDLGANILRLVEPMRVYQRHAYADDQDGQLYGIDINTLRREYPLTHLRIETPDRFATVFRDNENQASWKVQMSSCARVDTKVDFDIIEVPDDLVDSDQSFPKVPIEHRTVLETAVAHYLCLEKEDSKADYFFKLTQAKLASMQVSEQKEIQQTSKQKGKFIPRADMANKRRGLFRGRY